MSCLQRQSDSLLLHWEQGRNIRTRASGANDSPYLKSYLDAKFVLIRRFIDLLAVVPGFVRGWQLVETKHV